MPATRTLVRDLLLYLGLALIGAILFLPVYESDPNFVLYRFSAKLRESSSLLYGMIGGEVTAFPLAPLLLAGLSGFGIDPQLGGWLIVVLALALGGYLLSRLSTRGWIVGAAFILAGLAQPSPAALLMVVLGLGAVIAAQKERWCISGILGALALSADPYTLPLLLILGLWASTAGWSAFRCIAFPVLAVALVLGGLLALYGVSGWLPLSPPEISVALPLMALAALIFRHKTVPRPVAALGAWAALSATLAFLSGSLPNSAILPGVIGLSAWLIEPHPARLIVIAAAVFDLGLGVIVGLPFNTPDNDGLPDSVQVGQWVSAHLRPEDSLVIDTFDSARMLGFYAHTRIIDLNRIKVDPNFLIRYAPDALALRTSAPGVPPEMLVNRYAKVQQSGDIALYVRVVNWSDWQDHGVDVNFSAALDRDDLRLVNVAVNNVVHPGELVRVRLDWILAHKPTFQGELEIKLDLLDPNFSGFAPGTLDKYPASVWTQGAFSTYHLIDLPASAPEGQGALYLNLSIRAANVGTLKIADVTVKR